MTNTLKYESNTIQFEIPQDRYQDFLEHTGADLFLNETWTLDEEDYTQHEMLFRTVMTDELYERLLNLFQTGQKKYIELMRSPY